MCVFALTFVIMHVSNVLHLKSSKVQMVAEKKHLKGTSLEEDKTFACRSEHSVNDMPSILLLLPAARRVLSLISLRQPMPANS